MGLVGREDAGERIWRKGGLERAEVARIEPLEIGIDRPAGDVLAARECAMALPESLQLGRIEGEAKQAAALELWIDSRLFAQPGAERRETTEALETEAEQRRVEARLADRCQHPGRRTRGARGDGLGFDQPHRHPLARQRLGDREPDRPSAHDEDLRTPRASALF
jgi:hypothetical protein